MRNWHFSNFYFFYFTTVGIIVPYWSLYLQYRGFSAMEIGELMAILLLTKVLAPNIWAAIADNLVAKKGHSLVMLQYATLTMTVVFSGTYFASTFWSMAVAMFGFCVFWNACLPQLEAATLNHLGDQREQYGLIRLWGSIGFVVTVLGLGWLMDCIGPKAIMPSAGLAMFAAFLASFLLRDKAAKPTEQQRLLVPLSTLLNINVMTLLLLCVFMQMSHAPFYTFFSIYLESYGYSKFNIGVLWSVGVFFEILIFIFGYRLLRRFSLSGLLTFTFFIASLRWCLVAALPENESLVFITQAMHAVTYGLYHSVMIQLVNKLFVGRYQIRGQALYSSLTFGLGGAIGSFLSGIIWTHYGHNELFYAAGIMMALVFIFSLLVAAKITGETSHMDH